MKCRYTESVSNTSLVVTTSRSGVVSLGCSLAFDDRITMFAICIIESDGSARWLTLWTRKFDGGPVVVNDLLEHLHPLLQPLDARLVENVVQFVTTELEQSGVEVSDPVSWEPLAYDFADLNKQFDDLIAKLKAKQVKAQSKD